MKDLSRYPNREEVVRVAKWLRDGCDALPPMNWHVFCAGYVALLDDRADLTAKLETAEQERTKWKALFDEASRRAEESRRTARRMDRPITKRIRTTIVTERRCERCCGSGYLNGDGYPSARPSIADWACKDCGGVGWFEEARVTSNEPADEMKTLFVGTAEKG